MTAAIEAATRLLVAARRVLRARAVLASAEAELVAERAALGVAAEPLLQELLGSTARVEAPAAPVAVDEFPAVAGDLGQPAVKPLAALAPAAADMVQDAAPGEPSGELVGVPAYAARLGVGDVASINQLIRRGVLTAPAVVVDGHGRRRLRAELADAQILAAGLSKASTVRAAVLRLRLEGASPVAAAAAPTTGEPPAAVPVTVGQYARGLKVANGAIAALVRGGQLRPPAVTADRRIVPEIADRQILERRFKQPSTVQQRVRERSGLSAAERQAVEAAIAAGRISKDPGPPRFDGGMRFDGRGSGTVEIGL